MPALYWLDVAMISASALIATSLGLAVLGSGPRRLLNLSFSLFIFIEAAWAICSLLLRLSLWLDKGDPTFLAELVTLIYSLMGPALLFFAVRYVSRKSFWVDIFSLLGFIGFLLLCIPLFNHQLVYNPFLSANGSTILELSTLGIVLGMLPIAYILWSLVLFWINRRRIGEPQLPISVAVFLVGFILGGMLELPIPVLAITNTISVSLLGYAILSRQIFNPLRQANIELERQVQLRTVELETAYTEVEKKVEERTVELTHEIGERENAETELRERASRLELVAHVGQRATAILGQGDLLEQSAALIRNTFEYYNVSILLSEGEQIVLRAITLPILKPLVGSLRLGIGKQGITGWVAAKGEPLLVPDVSKDHRFYAAMVEEKPNSELAVPIKLHDRMMGVLDVQSVKLNAFTDADLFTLQTVADQLAIALENARLYEETRKRAERLSVVNRIAAKLGSLLETDDLLETVYQELTTIFQGDAFLLALYDEANNELDFRVMVDENVREPQTRKPLGTGLTSLVISRHKPLVFADLEKEKKSLPAAETWGTQKLPRSWMGAPMQVGGRITGVICLQSYHANTYSPEELFLLSTVTEQVGIALENARLYEAIRAELVERKRAEEVLRESEEKFRNLAEQSPNMIFINTLGKISYANQVCEDMLGYTREEFYSPEFDFLSLIAPEHLDLIQGTYAKHFAGEDVLPYEYALVTKADRRIDVIITTKLMKYEGQKAILGIITDISNRKRTEKLLQTFNKAALEMERALTPESIFTVMGNELNRIGYSSIVFLSNEKKDKLELKYLSYHPDRVTAAEKLVGFTAEEYGVPFSALKGMVQILEQRNPTLMDSAEAARSLLPMFPKKMAKRVAVVLKAASRSIISPLVAENDLFGLLIIQANELTEEDVPTIAVFSHQMAASWRKANLMEDLSSSLEELKRTQEQLLQSQKMEAVGRLAGGVAHDFNNLLTAITGYADLLLLDCLEKDPMRSDLEEIKNAAERAGSLTRQLLAFSRKQMLQPRVLDLNEVVINVEKMLRRVIGEDIELHTVPAPDLLSVRADPSQMEQVLMNLAVNARDAMPQGGYLTIETANRICDEEYVLAHPDLPPGQYVMLAVSDTGVGMDKETQNQLFEPFFTTKDHGKGTGLGLSTVYGIIKQSSGDIWVYSEPGKGSTFKIYLPVASEESEDAKEEVVSKIDLRGTETILLVEDEAMLRDLAFRILHRNGYTVLEAGNAEEALNLTDKHQELIHLLVTDVVMPGGMSGTALAEKLAEERPEMQVLFISGYTDGAVVKAEMLKPGAPFLQKPFTPDSLAIKVREILNASMKT